jgi:thymidylate synthase
MNNLDKTYTDLLQDILDNGVQKGDRTGTGTISVFGRQIRHKMSEGFPLITTKKMAWKSIVTELLWFLRGDTNIKYLVDNNCHIWDGDAYKNYEKAYEKDNSVGLSLLVARMDGKSTYRKPTKEQFIAMIQADDEFAKKWGELGPIYGKQWRSWNGNGQPLTKDYEGNISSYLVKEIDQISNLINDLKTNPDSRRLMVSAWNVGELDQMVLPPCHYGFQVYTRELSLNERRVLVSQEMFNQIYNGGGPETLSHSEINQWNIPTRAISLMWNQRSVDTFLGLPFNIASYGLLLEIIAKAVNMVPDELIGNLGDTHLYLNHIEQAKEQIGRKYQPEERSDLLKTAMGEEQYNHAVSELMPFGGGMSEYYEYYEIPTRTREPFDLPKLAIQKTDAFWKDFDINQVSHLDPADFVIENYKSHPTIKAPLSN